MGTKISALPQDTAPTTTDYVVTVDTETGLTKKVLIADLITTLATTIQPSGVITAYGGKTAPTGFLLCDGSAVSRTTYATLFGLIVPSVGTCTITNATPAVVTLNSHGLQTGDQVYLTTTGTLPTGLSPNTLYYAIRIDANTFNLATSRANAYAATKIATSSAGSGTHTLRDCPFGLGDGSTTFNIPDLRGRQPAGNDSMGGTVASRLTAVDTTNGVYGNRGAAGGNQSHTLQLTEMAAHTHSIGTSANFVTGSPFASADVGTNNVVASGSAGGGGTHNNVQPTLVTNFIIKT